MKATRLRFDSGTLKPVSCKPSGAQMRCAINASNVIPDAFSTIAPSRSVLMP